MLSKLFHALMSFLFNRLATVTLLCGLGGLWLTQTSRSWTSTPTASPPGRNRSAAGAAKAMTRPFGMTITQPARARHTGTVILLHGLGDTGHGWAPVGPQLNLPHLKFLYPTAPTRPVTVNMGMRMPAWFDIPHLDPQSLAEMERTGRPMDAEGIAESVAHVKGLIDKEIEAGLPANRIVVGGFSQGGHVALKVALTHTPPLGGCVAMSTWLEPSKLEIPPENLKTPIFQAHGDSDPLIPPSIGVTSHEILKDRGCTATEFRMYNGMAHSSCAQELRDLRAFLLRVLPEEQLTKGDLQKMSARELKQFLEGRGASTVGLLEKPELLEKAHSLL